jgi:hypothetical protein
MAIAIPVAAQTDVVGNAEKKITTPPTIATSARAAAHATKKSTKPQLARKQATQMHEERQASCKGPNVPRLSTSRRPTPKTTITRH